MAAGTMCGSRGRRHSLRRVESFVGGGWRLWEVLEVDLARFRRVKPVDNHGRLDRLAHDPNTEGPMSGWYQEYLSSAGWQRRRMVVIRLARYTCQRCHWNVYEESGRWLEVHHLSYANLGDELVGDVEVLCSVCHAGAHGVAPRTALPWGFQHVREIIPRALEQMRPGIRKAVA